MALSSVSRGQYFTGFSATAWTAWIFLLLFHRIMKCNGVFAVGYTYHLSVIDDCLAHNNRHPQVLFIPLISPANSVTKDFMGNNYYVFRISLFLARIPLTVPAFAGASIPFLHKA